MKKLGPLVFSNPTLFISKLKDMNFTEDLLEITKAKVEVRADRIKILCSKCRRKATIERF